MGADPDIAQKNGSTALHVASYYGHTEIVRCLLEAGANPYIPNNFTPPSTARQEAAILGDESIELVFQEIADDPTRNQWIQASTGSLPYFKENNLYIDINTPNDHGQTLLHLAAKNGHRELVKYLISLGADYKLRDKCGNTPFESAHLNNHTQVVQVMITLLCV